MASNSLVERMIAIHDERQRMMNDSEYTLEYQPPQCLEKSNIPENSFYMIDVNKVSPDYYKNLNGDVSSFTRNLTKHFNANVNSYIDYSYKKETDLDPYKLSNTNKVMQKNYIKIGRASCMERVYGLV